VGKSPRYAISAEMPKSAESGARCYSERWRSEADGNSPNSDLYSPATRPKLPETIPRPARTCPPPGVSATTVRCQQQDGSPACGDLAAAAIRSSARCSSCSALPGVVWPSSNKRPLHSVARPARDAGITHRRQGAADDSLRGGDQAAYPRNFESLAEFEANGADDHPNKTTMVR